MAGPPPSCVRSTVMLRARVRIAAQLLNCISPAAMQLAPQRPGVGLAISINRQISTDMCTGRLKANMVQQADDLGHDAHLPSRLSAASSSCAKFVVHTPGHLVIMGSFPSDIPHQPFLLSSIPLIHGSCLTRYDWASLASSPQHDDITAHHRWLLWQFVT